MARAKSVETVATNGVWLALVLAAAFGQSPLAGQEVPPMSRPILFVNVGIIPMDEERVITGRALLVVDGVIDAIGKRDTISPPPDTLVIDGKGGYILPGLVDMHVHLEHPSELLLYLANGVTTIRNLNGSPDHLEWRKKIRSGEWTGPTLHTSGPLTAGEPVRFRHVLVNSAEAARLQVRSQAKAGYDFIKAYDGLTAETYAALLGEASAIGIPVVGHVPHDVEIESAIDSGQLTIEHVAPMVHSIHGFGDKKNDERLAKVAQRMAARDVWLCPTLASLALWSRQIEKLEDVFERPELTYMPRSTVSWWRAAIDGLHPLTPRMHKRSVELLRYLHAAGVRIVAGTDNQNALTVPGFSMHDELTLLTEAGFSPYEAIHAATAEAARCLGTDRWVGTVAVDKRADLILVQGNPLKSVSHLRDMQGVMVHGKWMSVDTLQVALDQLADDRANERNPGIAPILRRCNDERLVGTYGNANGSIITIAHDGRELLWLDLAAGVSRRLVAVDTDRYKIARDGPPVLLRFSTHENRKPATLNVTRNDADTTLYTRRPDYTRRELVVTSGGTRLGATFFAPVGTGPHPCAVLLHGSGPDDRFARHFGHSKLFVADWFARNGVAALVFDKRPVGRGWDEGAFSQLAADALAAVSVAQEQPEVDRYRIGLWGHSQGGWIGLLAASMSSEIAFVVTVANGLGPAWELERFSAVTHAVGHDDDETNRISADEYMTLYLNVARTGANWDRYEKFCSDHAGEAWFARISETWRWPDLATARRSWSSTVGFDTRPLLSILDIPLLAIVGGNDTVNSTLITKKYFDDYVERNDHSASRFAVFPGANHGIRLVDGHHHDGPFAPGFLQLMSNWISALSPARETSINSSGESK